MSQNDFNIANGDGASVRADINSALQALVSKNSGVAEPGTTYAGMTWWDTTNNILKLRNGANNAWINWLNFDGTNIQYLFKKGSDVASATALAITAEGNYFDVTGTTTITSIASVGVGAVIKLHFDGALTLTHHATDLILPKGANITTAAGDEAEFVEYASGDWRLTKYTRASGIIVADLNSAAALAGQVLTANGSGGATWANSQSGLLVPIVTKTASMDASIDFIHGVGGVILDGTYKAYVLEIIGLVLETDARDLYLRTSQDGSTFDNGASDYGYKAFGGEQSNATVSVQNAGASTFIKLNAVDQLGNETGERFNGQIKVFQPNIMARTQFLFNSTYRNTAGGSVWMNYGGGSRNENDVVLGLRIEASADAIASGTFTLSGVKDA